MQVKEMCKYNICPKVNLVTEIVNKEVDVGQALLRIKGHGKFHGEFQVVCKPETCIIKTFYLILINFSSQETE